MPRWLTINDVDTNPDNILAKELKTALGKGWIRRASREAREARIRNLNMAQIERICKNLRMLVPLPTALMIEGFNFADQKVMHRCKTAVPFDYAWMKFEGAIAEAEANAVSQLNDPATSDRQAKKLMWLLERALGDAYAPRSKSTKVTIENKSVNVKMKVSENTIKNPQPPQLAASLEVYRAKRQAEKDKAITIDVEPITTSDKILKVTNEL